MIVSTCLLVDATLRMTERFEWICRISLRFLTRNFVRIDTTALTPVKLKTAHDIFPEFVFPPWLVGESILSPVDLKKMDLTWLWVDRVEIGLGA